VKQKRLGRGEGDYEGHERDLESERQGRVESKESVDLPKLEKKGWGQEPPSGRSMREEADEQNREMTVTCSR